VSLFLIHPWFAAEILAYKPIMKVKMPEILKGKHPFDILLI